MNYSIVRVKSCESHLKVSTDGNLEKISLEARNYFIEAILFYDYNYK